MNIIYDKYRSVSGFNKRQRFLVLHYTAENFKSSVGSLTGPNVSIHYLIPDETDQTYLAAGYRDMNIFNIVDENDRAWHAGVSYWRGRNNINDSSIGIELVNLATENKGDFQFPCYTSKQIDAVKELSKNILARYPDITPRNVVGHSDIAPGRKSDPGAAFPWEELAKAGIGAWYDEEIKQAYLKRLTEQTNSSELLPKDVIVTKLQAYGYDVSNAATNIGFANLIRTFQLHFRPSRYDGIVDRETAAILFALTEKYPNS